MPDEERRRDLFAAIDRATRWVYVELLDDKSAASASSFLARLIAAAPFTIAKVLTDNGKEFTDRVCAAQGTEHRLIKPKHPQTNGMIERFNGRIAEVLATMRFDSSQSLEQTLIQYVKVYNQHIPQKALGHIAPIQALRTGQQNDPSSSKNVSIISRDLTHSLLKTVKTWTDHMIGKLSASKTPESSMVCFSRGAVFE